MGGVAPSIHANWFLGSHTGKSKFHTPKPNILCAHATSECSTATSEARSGEEGGAQCTAWWMRYSTVYNVYTVFTVYHFELCDLTKLWQGHCKTCENKSNIVFIASPHWESLTALEGSSWAPSTTYSASMQCRRRGVAPSIHTIVFLI